jgi:hypothetical protein
MTKAIVRSPFEKFELPDQLRLEPNTIRHFVGCEPLSPTATSRFWQIHERAFGRLQTLKPLEQLLAGCRRESVPGPRNIEQFPVLVVAEKSGHQMHVAPACSPRLRIPGPG